ncbi:MAG: peptide deformylase [Candidatus Harrisonbacteria bacterium CG10_big_fil_rev_8_21_14_0_10_49_15]|uniref:Peptide deformylase n=1 Tax=Candidatus Harrisonbacteria bacterium CG10_big_fil_rev_8_21_14_0_10_49_15 TaxID=1974587 RepID=A0A2H0UK65_9BACT|nr:MAG: peptide deformylase [Candidatus Harrisonbacteria bacterium CG10_big_fil_rev_8_21_14_0_10_49_15]
MKLYTIKNKKEEKLLRTALKPFDFSAYSKKEIKELVREMRHLMKISNGVGLAGNQAGLNAQVFVAQSEGKFYAIFNPVITKTYGKPVEMEEGCLSVPNTYGATKRYKKILLTGADQNGKPIKIKAWDLLAHIFQHETDHLNGILYIDHALRLYNSLEDPKQLNS